MRALVAVLAAAAALAGGCGGGSGGSGSGQVGPGPRTASPANPDITMQPLKTEGSGDFPKAEARVGVDCQTMLKNRQYEDAAGKMGKVASDRGSTDGERAIARVCEAAANANLGKHRKALSLTDEAKGDIDAIPPKLRGPTLDLLFHTELFSAMAVGDTGRARDALDHLMELGHVPSDYIRDACAVAPDPGALPECATATMTGSPPGEQETPTPQPEESGTEPAEESTSTEPPDEETSEPPDTEDGGPTSRES
ncbi:hypothetical protein [Nonomuraea sp. NPDC049400]|uniref:hypothetical protein n=1 Tax=Nonomuraea sp. NPDC049400 TaxID=3364352 RepID=UPI0037BA71DE